MKNCNNTQKIIEKPQKILKFCNLYLLEKEFNKFILLKKQEAQNGQSLTFKN